ncbi:MAG TPA: hypothetical protein VKB25_09900 [Conexibacter sp.]|nr:hypothetical protein [Conexibacter sp.]
MSDEARRAPDDGEGQECREVRAADPSLSPEANRVLTDELRQVVGRDEVEVPGRRPHVEHEHHGGRTGVAVLLAEHRLVIAMTLLAALVVGAIVSLATGSWWFLPLALGFHAFGTIVVLTVALAMTTETEHLSPSAAAQLEDEGVSDPDRVFNDLVEEFAPADRRGDERATAAHDDPAQAAAEQRSSVTPSQEPSRPVGP